MINSIAGEHNPESINIKNKQGKLRKNFGRPESFDRKFWRFTKNVGAS
jgi:hypothetical protein